MTVAQREAEEKGGIRGQLVQKLESYLRAHFDGESASASEEPVERLLWQAGRDWLVNRGLSVDEDLLAGAVKDALGRYKRNWSGKVQGEDDRSHALGRALEGRPKGYAV